MSELKIYYDHKVNMKRINITEAVMNEIETGQKKKRMPRRSMVLLISMLVIVISLGCTYIYEMSFSNGDGGLWKVIFEDTDKIEIAYQAYSEEVDIEDGEIACLYINEDNPEQRIVLYDTQFIHEDLEEINTLALSLYQIELEAEVFGLPFMEGKVSYDIEWESLSEILREMTPEGERSHVIYNMDGIEEVYCSSDDVTLIENNLPMTLISQDIHSISYRFDNGDKLFNIYFNEWLGNEIHVHGQEDYVNNDKLMYEGYELWVSSSDAWNKIVYLADGLKYEIGYSRGVAKQDEVLEFFVENIPERLRY